MKSKEEIRDQTDKLINILMDETDPEQLKIAFAISRTLCWVLGTKTWTPTDQFLKKGSDQ